MFHGQGGVLAPVCCGVAVDPAKREAGPPRQVRGQGRVLVCVRACMGVGGGQVFGWRWGVCICACACTLWVGADTTGRRAI